MAAHDPRPIFAAMFAAVRAYLLGAGAESSAAARVATNPKGEATRAFDAMAERIALVVAREGLGGFRAVSEEAGEIAVGRDPRWTRVMDPCDGSNNFRRGMRAVGFAVAALPAGAPLDPALVEYALCGDIFTGTVYAAARGQGATVDGRPIAASRTPILHHAMLGINLGRERAPAGDMAGDTEDAGGDRPPIELVLGLLQRAATVRRTGATVLDLCYVAQGTYDAYADLRDRLTPENFLAPALILAEAGARFTNAHGLPLGPVEFTRPYSVLAASNDALLRDILHALGVQ